MSSGEGELTFIEHLLCARQVLGSFHVLFLTPSSQGCSEVSSISIFHMKTLRVGDEAMGLWTHSWGTTEVELSPDLRTSCSGLSFCLTLLTQESTGRPL